MKRLSLDAMVMSLRFDLWDKRDWPSPKSQMGASAGLTCPACCGRLCASRVSAFSVSSFAPELASVQSERSRGWRPEFSEICGEPFVLDFHYIDGEAL